MWMFVFLEENVNPANKPRFPLSEKHNFHRLCVTDPLVGQFTADPLLGAIFLKENAPWEYGC